MISIKMYLDRNSQSVTSGKPVNELLAVTMDAYGSTLRAIGRTAVQVCTAPGRDLEQSLASQERRLSLDAPTKSVREAQAQVESSLKQWGSDTEQHFKIQASQVKELLILLAGTADSVGERDHRYGNQFAGFTTELKAIANLDDLTQIRSSLVKKATELKNCVDQMAQDGQNSLAQLRSKLTSYETKLKAVELLASKDPLTNLANRRSAESRIEWGIENNQTFCVVIIDLNGFKQINDRFGHAAGDGLLKSFSQELRENARSGDLVGRWGGDEFIVVLSRDLAGAKPQIAGIRQSVLGGYTIQTAAGPVEVTAAASIGVAQWRPGQSVMQVVEEADAAMYRDKEDARKKN